MEQVIYLMGFPGGPISKESSCNAGDPGLIPGWEDRPEKEMTTDSSILPWEIPWTEGWATDHGVARVGHDLVTKVPPGK